MNIAGGKTWTEIFNAGTKIASNGRKYHFTLDDLDQVVESYSPLAYRAPLILGHRTFGKSDRELAKSKELCFGAVSRLKRIGNKLFASFDPVSPEVREWIDTGKILDRSASFYPPNAQTNPSPGKWALRHIALLGQTPPSVKGMEPLNLAEFSSSDSDCIYFSKKMSISQVFSGIRDVLTELHGIETAKSILPDPLIASFEEEETSIDRERHMEVNTTMQTEINQLREELSQQKQARRKDKIANFMEQNSDRLTPAMISDLQIEFGDETATENFQKFAQGLSDTQLAYFEKFVQQIPKQVEFGELTNSVLVTSNTQTGGRFNNKSASFDQKIKAYQQAHPELSYSEVLQLPEFSEQLKGVI